MTGELSEHERLRAYAVTSGSLTISAGYAMDLWREYEQARDLRRAEIARAIRPVVADALARSASPWAPRDVLGPRILAIVLASLALWLAAEALLALAILATEGPHGPR